MCTVIDWYILFRLNVELGRTISSYGRNLGCCKYVVTNYMYIEQYAMTNWYGLKSVCAIIIWTSKQVSSLMETLGWFNCSITNMNFKIGALIIWVFEIVQFFIWKKKDLTCKKKKNVSKN